MASDVTVKGSTLLYTIKWIKKNHDVQTFEQILAALPEETRKHVQGALVGAMFPVTDLCLFLEAIKKVIAPNDPEINYRIGHASFNDAFSIVYKVFLKFGSPEFVLEKATLLWKNFSASGTLSCPELAPGRAVLRMVDFPYHHPEFCQQRLRGGFQAVIELCGVKIKESRHPTCCLRGDPYCEWLYNWK